jgi:hypothetical protein
LLVPAKAAFNPAVEMPVLVDQNPTTGTSATIGDESVVVGVRVAAGVGVGVGDGAATATSKGDVLGAVAIAVTADRAGSGVDPQPTSRTASPRAMARFTRLA